MFALLAALTFAVSPLSVDPCVPKTPEIVLVDPCKASTPVAAQMAGVSVQALPVTELQLVKPAAVTVAEFKELNPTASAVLTPSRFLAYRWFRSNERVVADRSSPIGMAAQVLAWAEMQGRPEEEVNALEQRLLKLEDLTARRKAARAPKP